MDSVDLSVLKAAKDWKLAGFGVTLITVIETWGSAPRPPGALLAIRSDGLVSGSVSGGCVEDDLIARVKASELVTEPGLVLYGVTKEEAARFGLPCGGTLRLVQEPIVDTAWIEELLARCARHEIVARTLNIKTGKVTLEAASRADQLSFDGALLRCIHGPRWRLLMIGAGQLSQYVAHFALALDFEVIVCDPREEYHLTWEVPNTQFTKGMPDDVVLELAPDAHTAIVALTHDPKLDDMALLEALKSPAFYIGALGSRVNTANRKERMAMFDLSQDEISRLHGPIGLHIGSRTPAEIAVSIVAEIVSVKNGIALAQKKPALTKGLALATAEGPVCGV
jgi:xanthine dehydrogenase accessory factor